MESMTKTTKNKMGGMMMPTKMDVETPTLSDGGMVAALLSMATRTESRSASPSPRALSPSDEAKAKDGRERRSPKAAGRQMRVRESADGRSVVQTMPVLAGNLAGRSEDGYKWRKYGQKLVKGHGHPRSYYKCSTTTCPAKKQIEVLSRSFDAETNTDVVSEHVLYRGTHNHPAPVRAARRTTPPTYRATTRPSRSPPRAVSSPTPASAQSSPLGNSGAPADAVFAVAPPHTYAPAHAPPPVAAPFHASAYPPPSPADLQQYAQMQLAAQMQYAAMMYQHMHKHQAAMMAAAQMAASGAAPLPAPLPAALSAALPAPLSLKRAHDAAAPFVEPPLKRHRPLPTA